MLLLLLLKLHELLLSHPLFLLLLLLPLAEYAHELVHRVRDAEDGEEEDDERFLACFLRWWAANHTRG